MRYFVDTPMFGTPQMCARVTGDIVETRIFNDPETNEWSVFDMPVEQILEMVDLNFLVELDEDPFKEYDCPDDH